MKYYFLCIESFWEDFRCVHRFQLLNVCKLLCHPSKFSPRTERIQGTIQVNILSKLMDSWLVFRRDRVILNQWTKRDDWSFTRFSKASFVWSLSIRQEVLNVSQIGITFHRICPPIFIQTWLQQYRRRTFFHSAYCLSQQSHLFPICVVSTYNDSIKDLHRLHKNPRNCQKKRL